MANVTGAGNWVDDYRLADTEWSAEMAPTFAGTRAQYSTIANDPSRFHHVLSDPDAHPDDRYALEKKMMLMGMYVDRNQKDMTLEEATGRSLDRATMYPETYEDEFYGDTRERWVQARVPHLGSAREGLLKGQIARPGHAYVFPGIYEKQLQPGGQFATKDTFGQDLVYDPKDTIRHEVGHDASREFMYMMRTDYENMVKSGGRPHKDTIGAKFVDRVGFNNVGLFYDLNDSEELLNRYEDFIVGSPAKKQLAREYMDNFVKETTAWHQYVFDEAQFLKNYKLPRMEKFFSQEQLKRLNNWLDVNIEKHGSMGAIMMGWPKDLFEGTKNKFGEPWKSSDMDDDIEDFIRVKTDILDYEQQMSEAKRQIEGTKIIPLIYDAQLQGMRELKEEGLTLGSPPFPQSDRNR